MSPLKRSRIRSKRKGPPRRRSGASREYLDWLREQPCVITGKRTGEIVETEAKRIGDYWIQHWQHVSVDPAHVRVKRLGGDLYNAVSLSRHLHLEQHQHGIKTFQAKYGVDLKDLARRQTEQFLALDKPAF